MRRIVKCDVILSAFFLVSNLLLQVTTSKAQAANITDVQINACAVDASNNLIITGFMIDNNNIVSGVARYTSAGALDASFGFGGFTLSSVGSRVESEALAVQSDGKIVTAGFAVINNVTQVVLARYASNGSLDAAFGSAGIVTTQIGEGSTANSIALQADGNIVVAGVAVIDGTPQFLVARYNNTDGSLDTSFNSAGTLPGTVTTPIGVRASGFSLIIQPGDGKIVVAGTTATGTQNNFALVRYNTDGSYDTSFGVNGFVTTALGAYDQIFSIALDGSGNIVAAGSSSTSIALARYLSSNGALDTTFNSGGPIPGTIVASIGNAAAANSVIIDASDNIIVGGFSDLNMLLARYTSSGILDTRFGSNATGIVTIAIETTNVCTDLVFQSTNIMVSGYADKDTLIMRFNDAGIVDSIYGTNGIVNRPGNANLFTTIWEQQSPGTNGGTFTSGSWQTRTLNSITTLNNTNVALSNNQFTLNPGLYLINVMAPAYRVDNHQTRLQNITDGVTTMLGTSGFSSSSNGTLSNSYINGQFAVSKPTVFEVQHMCATTQANDGLGIASGFGDELYTNVRITINFSF